MKLEKEIINWAHEKGIFKKGTPLKQGLKTLEECQELLIAIADDNEFEIKDAIGDIIVTLVIQAAMQGLNIDQCVESVYNEIKDRQGVMIDGQFIRNK